MDIIFLSIHSLYNKRDASSKSQIECERGTGPKDDASLPPLSGEGSGVVLARPFLARVALPWKLCYSVQSLQGSISCLFFDRFRCLAK